MLRSELEHIIRASGDADEDEIIVVGSQAVLGQFPNAPMRLLSSMEADVYPNNDPELADKIDGAIGEGSSFHELHGYYASSRCSVLEADWVLRSQEKFQPGDWSLNVDIMSRELLTTT